MKVLVAEDDPVSRRLLQATLEKWGYPAVTAGDGAQAWSLLVADPSIRMAVLDWMMPNVDGLALCRRIRTELKDRPVYVLVCTARKAVDDVVRGLDAGANDYLVKPLRSSELHARIRVGIRTLELEEALRRRIAELDDALAHVKRLQGLLPICMHCKRIRNARDVWQATEQYLEDHADVEFSHGLCDRCYEERYAQPRGGKA